jgi:TonB family protein
VAPIYPQVAREARREGVVILEAVIDASGNVTSVRVLKGDPLLDQAALDAVQQWKFTPARYPRRDDRHGAVQIAAKSLAHEGYE